MLRVLHKIKFGKRLAVDILHHKRCAIDLLYLPSNNTGFEKCTSNQCRYNVM